MLRCQLVHGTRSERKIVVSGDACFFPMLQGGTQMELCQWLDDAQPQTRDYFVQQIRLFASLVRGRNVRTTPPMQALLPYPLIATAISDARLRRHHLDVATTFVMLARTAWVDNDVYANVAPSVPDVSGTFANASGGRLAAVREPHRKMVYVKTVRVWSRVLQISQDRMLSSRYNLSNASAPDWEQFDQLKQVALDWIAQHPVQNATQIGANTMAWPAGIDPTASFSIAWRASHLPLARFPARADARAGQADPRPDPDRVLQGEGAVWDPSTSALPT